MIVEFQELIPTLVQTVLIPLLIALTGFAIKWINAKANQLKAETSNDLYYKYIDMLQSTVTKAVITVNQTYVEELKKENSFTKEAQQEAFKKVYEAVMSSLSEDVFIYLKEVVGDFDDYLTVLIESAVKMEKK